MLDVVVKIGGGVLTDALRRPDLADLQTYLTPLEAIDAAATNRRILIIPGGGPFADAVRAVDARAKLPSDPVHWMAILAMDQHAHLIASKLPDAVVVTSVTDIANAIDTHRLPVLAPFRWLRKVDPLPHTWDVTSDSIAAWTVGQLGARSLVLIKPPGVRADLGSVDPYFTRALPANVAVKIVAADDVAALHSALNDS